MRAVVQRSGPARVEVAGKTVGQIESGLLIYLGVEQDDTTADSAYLAQKIAGLRIFPDDEDKMNRSVLETGGELLVVSQFTLLADARKGRRPSYNRAAPPEMAHKLYQDFIEQLSGLRLSVAEGIFQASMQVYTVNLGPVTILLDSRKDF